MAEQLDADLSPPAQKLTDTPAAIGASEYADGYVIFARLCFAAAFVFCIWGIIRAFNYEYSDAPVDRLIFAARGVALIGIGIACGVIAAVSILASIELKQRSRVPKEKP